jgi:hypothetical protein
MCSTLPFQFAMEHFNLGNAVHISMEMNLNLVPYPKTIVVQQGLQKHCVRPCTLSSPAPFRNIGMQISFTSELSAKKSDLFAEIAEPLLSF